MGIEGFVSKRADALYTSGRSNAWSKITCRKRETFVVAGLAYNKRKFEGINLARRDDMSYAGKVEHGFTLQTQHDLEVRKRKLDDRTTPMTSKISKRRHAGCSLRY